jgi:hypothetical protein
MLKTIRTNFDREELRRDRRYPMPLITVSLAGLDYATANWSLGGFRLENGPQFSAGEAIAGLIRLADASEYPFTAAAVRSDADGAGFQFTELSLALVGALDRVASGRLRRRAS